MSLKQRAQFLRDDLLKTITADITGQILFVSVNQRTFLRLHENGFIMCDFHLDPTEWAWVPGKLYADCERLLAVGVRLTFQVTLKLYGKRTMC